MEVQPIGQVDAPTFCPCVAWQARPIRCGHVYTFASVGDLVEDRQSPVLHLCPSSRRGERVNENDKQSILSEREAGARGVGWGYLLTTLPPFPGALAQKIVLTGIALNVTRGIYGN